MFLASWVAGNNEVVNTATNDPYFYDKADVNNDGAVNGADVVYMASSVAGLPGFNVGPIEPEPQPEPQPFIPGDCK